MEKRNTLLLTVIAVATLLVAVVGATFAYFASSIEPGEGLNLDVTAEASTAQFAAQGVAINMTVTPDLMQEGNTSNTITETAGKQQTSTFTVTLGTDAAAVTCTYNIRYKWDAESDTYTPTTGLASVNNGHEFTIQATLATNPQVTAGENDIQNETNFDQVSITDPVIEGATIKVDGTTKEATATWTFVTKFYNLALDQSALAGEDSKTYSGNFYADDVVC